LHLFRPGRKNHPAKFKLSSEGISVSQSVIKTKPHLPVLTPALLAGFHPVATPGRDTNLNAKPNSGGTFTAIDPRLDWSR
jgi:hypothetical protein